FQFRAPEGCGSADDFAARVAKRSARIKLSADGGGARALSVEIDSPDAAGVVRGRVTVVEPDGATRARQLKAPTCDEALDGLSLIATVTLDPEAFMGEPVPPPDEPTPVPKPAPATPKAPRKPMTLPVRGEPLPLYRLGFGLSGAVLLRVAPEPAFGAQAAVLLELNPGHVLSPAWRLSVSHTRLGGVARGPGEANFAYTLPTIEACPVRLGPKAFGIRPCGFVTTGALSVWGSGVLEEEEHLRFFGAAGPALLFQVRLSKGIEIIADGRAGFAFKRDDFAFDSVPFFTTPALGFSSALGLAGGFP
ncbi:MAG TPA: hypothetical protein VEX18_10535, partial [Polyangiaceae bacterium]|nr:hypothetical protein [Polyangiaceae bacterium]